jgi:hypothetical protein
MGTTTTSTRRVHLADLLDRLRQSPKYRRLKAHNPTSRVARVLVQVVVEVWRERRQGASQPA